MLRLPHEVSPRLSLRHEYRIFHWGQLQKESTVRCKGLAGFSMNVCQPCVNAPISWQHSFQHLPAIVVPASSAASTVVVTPPVVATVAIATVATATASTTTVATATTSAAASTTAVATATATTTVATAATPAFAITIRASLVMA
mmetsp:Transcript_78908/g.118594  ORF Transcript_78908/g.118594 Transcript_78908/m.118594 type:complete len:144 (-) Transcript_78908:2461-2892(-)